MVAWSIGKPCGCRYRLIDTCWEAGELALSITVICNDHLDAWRKRLERSLTEDEREWEQELAL